MISRSHPSLRAGPANGRSRGHSFRRRWWLGSPLPLVVGVVVGSEAAGGSGVEALEAARVAFVQAEWGEVLGKPSAACVRGGAGDLGLCRTGAARLPRLPNEGEGDRGGGEERALLSGGPLRSAFPSDAF